MTFVGDPLSQLQPLVATFLACRSRKEAKPEIDAEIDVAIGWRPHIYERASKKAWHLHLACPETDSWQKRIERAKLQDTGLTVGVAAPFEALSDEDFLLSCFHLEAELITFNPDTWPPNEEAKLFYSVADFVIETRAQLSIATLQAMLNGLLLASKKEANSNRKGVLFEVLTALILSQVRGFEVFAVGISNRSQQMDVMVQNRNVGGALSGSPVILAEAKNWKDPVTPTEYAEFLRKLQSRHGRAKLGFLFTTSRFTDGVESEQRRESKGDYLVVLINGRDLVQIWDGSMPVTEKIEELVLRASVGS